MIKFIIASLFVAYSFSFAAIDKEQIVTMTHQVSTSKSSIKDSWDKSKRSLTEPFVVIHNQNGLYIYAYIYMENAQITISDRKENVLYTTVTSLNTENPNVISLNELIRGEYCIEVEVEGDYYYGYFEIIQ